MPPSEVGTAPMVPGRTFLFGNGERSVREGGRLELRRSGELSWRDGRAFAVCLMEYEVSSRGMGDRLGEGHMADRSTVPKDVRREPMSTDVQMALGGGGGLTGWA